MDNCLQVQKIPYDKKKGSHMLEIDDGRELTEDFLQEELHPKINLHRPKFAKPKGPPGRGAKRLTKVQDLGTSEQEI
ncbi:Twinfilin [Eufriesea mexicana]|uniref:Twinfilin n=1 Tax=Eufriesea mexicana TaxID=516756 RepID=A0A310SL35_9HYME|nr:Twinfilin [Eufriesea mexicana]